MNGWYFAAAIAAAVLFLCWYFRDDTEVLTPMLPPEPEPKESRPAIGTFRIIPMNGKIQIQRYVWQWWDDLGGWTTQGSSDSTGRCLNPWEFNTEEEAEKKIKSILDKEAADQFEKEEKKRKEEEFALAHPVREIPPYKYIRS